MDKTEMVMRRVVRPVVIDEPPRGDCTVVCPACGYEEYHSEVPRPRYCRECGARFEYEGVDA